MREEMRLISRAGKTFYFATRWLEKEARSDTVLAYNFCRFIDDIADARPVLPDRDARLSAVIEALSHRDASNDLVSPLLPLIARYPEIEEPLIALVEACRGDGPPLQIHDEVDLARYSHGVAGNVGLIMYPILGGTSPTGRAYAADLGIAMQYTNIARDVLEDRANGRIYLPSSWLAGCDPGDVLRSCLATEISVVAAVRRLLALADQRYAHGLSGLHYLSAGNRFAIRVAATCYAAIGSRVIRGERLARRRAVVPLPQKIYLACSLGVS